MRRDGYNWRNATGSWELGRTAGRGAKEEERDPELDVQYRLMVETLPKGMKPEDVDRLVAGVPAKAAEEMADSADGERFIDALWADDREVRKQALDRAEKTVIRLLIAELLTRHGIHPGFTIDMDAEQMAEDTLSLLMYKGRTLG